MASVLDKMLKESAARQGAKAAPSSNSVSSAKNSTVDKMLEESANRKKKPEPVNVEPKKSVEPTKSTPTSQGPRKSLLPTEGEKPKETISQPAPDQKPYLLDRLAAKSPFAVVSKKIGVDKLVEKVKKTAETLKNTKNTYTTLVDQGINIATAGGNPISNALAVTKSLRNPAGAKEEKQTNYATSSAGRFMETTLASLEDIHKRTARGLDGIVYSKHSTQAQKVNAVLDVGLAGANTLFLPAITEFNAQKAAVEASGSAGTKAGKIVDKGFSALSKLGSMGAGAALQAVPDSVLSPVAKEHLQQNVEEVGAQLSMIIGIGLLHGAVEKAKAGGETKTPVGSVTDVGGMFKRTLGIEKKGIPTHAEIEAAYKQVMESFAGKADYQDRAAMATTAYKALRDYHELGPEQFSQKWIETTRALETQAPKFVEEMRAKTEEANLHSDAAKVLASREAPIGDTEAGYRTQGDLSRSARDMYAAETVQNVKEAIRQEGGKEDGMPIKVVDEKGGPAARVDLQTGEIIVNPRTIIEMIDRAEESGSHRAGESRAALEQRLVSEAIQEQRAAIEGMTPKQELQAKASIETGDTQGLEKIQKSVNKEATKPSKVAEDVKAIAVEKGLMSIDEVVAQHSKQNIKEQSEKISDIITNDFEGVGAMIRGEKPIPEGVSPQLFFEAVAKIADQRGDVKLLYDLKESPIASARSYHASELRLSQGADPDSALANLRRAEKIKRESAKGGEKQVSKTVKEIKETIKKEKKPVTKETWISFIDSIAC